ncbi:MAG TPA: PQQ-binding-like beta-propeller repeat protein [Planctomycetota bacterium]|jgi:outer membrane protein assembly factor BamB
MHSRHVLLLAALLPTVSLAETIEAQWGEKFSRNMVSSEKNLPDSFDPVSGKNVKWVAKLGTETYGSAAVVAGGKVFIGTNNGALKNPKRTGDLGVLMCLDEKDGHFIWQLVQPKLEDDIYQDWPNCGLCSPATVEGDRVFTVTNRGEVVCLDINGMANGNDGPYLDEGKHVVLPGQPAQEIDKTDADIIWLFDIISGAGIRQHDSAHCSLLVHGDFLYGCTSNGVDNTHRKIRFPDAPGLIVLDKKTGRYVARDREGMSPRTIHSTLSSPSVGEVNGRPLVFFGGGDGWCYAFEPLTAAPPAGEVAALKCVWRFDCDPSAPKENIHQWQDNRREGPSTIIGMPVFYKNRVYVTAGGDYYHGKPVSWLKCIDASKTGDITKTGEMWSFQMNRYSTSTPAISDGLVYIADCSGAVHCLDAESGTEYWSHACKGVIWSSPFVADGKVFIGSQRRDFWILAAGKEKRVLCSVELDGQINGTVTAANGAFFVPTMRSLYCISK